MKRKIKYYLLGIALATLMSLTLIQVIIFYHFYQTQAIRNMKDQVQAFGELFEDRDTLINDLSKVKAGRFTLIDIEGNALFDTRADAIEMDNHLERKEIQQAIKNGEGYAVHKSKTLGIAMFYYALKLENGDILRYSREESGIWQIFHYTLIGILFIVIMMSFLCVAIAGRLTDHLIEPINQMAADIEHAAHLNPYQELDPFVRTIQNQHEEIVKGAKMRQEFTANVSHELKTPLTSISGYAELIAAGFADEKETIHFANEINNNAQRLLTLINDIIRLSELDGGHAETAFEMVDLCEIAKKVIGLLDFQARKNRIRLQMLGESTYIHANRSMIEELIYNLCDNAIRYNKAGGSVTIMLTESQGQVLLTVKDTGIGIPAESRERIFERFYRVDKSRSKATGGTGLGLAIVKHIVLFHHAHIEVESEMGHGTAMRVIFTSCKDRKVSD